jgi:hypothetical protein
MTQHRPALEAQWLHLTRVALPAIAIARGWPITADHCFQRVLLDMATDGVWYDAIRGRPAYAHAPDAVLVAAVRLAESALSGDADLAAMNARSLAWRRPRGDKR